MLVETHHTVFDFAMCAALSRRRAGVFSAARLGDVAARGLRSTTPVCPRQRVRTVAPQSEPSGKDTCTSVRA